VSQGGTSYIVRSDMDPGELKKTCETLGNHVVCSVKPVAADAYKVDLQSKQEAAPLSEPKLPIPSASDLQRLLPKSSVYENKVFSPLR
jgi:hypothetical protein